MTRLPNLDDYDLNPGDDDPADMYDRLSARAADIEAVRCADEACINLSGRGARPISPARCRHYFADGSRCTYTVVACPGHKEKSWEEFLTGRENLYNRGEHD